MRSASAWLARANAAAPNSVTVLRWPVLPNGRRAIIAPPLRVRRGRAATGTLMPEIGQAQHSANQVGGRRPTGSSPRGKTRTLGG